MRIAISNIAWDAEEDAAVAALLARYEIDAIDVAPTKYFNSPATTSSEEVKKVRGYWNDLGIEITGMQSLLFGTNGLNVFGSPESQHGMLRHLDSIFRIAAGLGGPRLVFGSPKNRDRTGLSDEEALDKASHFFRRLGDLAEKHAVLICLEPNPPVYGANFMCSIQETAQVVEATAHPAIKMQFDIGAVIINGEDPARALERHAQLVGHIHASEPKLVPLGDIGSDHEVFSTLIERHLPQHIVSVEMVATSQEPHLVSIERALQTAIKYYRRH